MDAMTKSQTTNRDITALLKAKNTLLWIVTREETRVERAVVEAAGNAKYEVQFWDCCDGLTGTNGDQLDAQAAIPNKMLAKIRSTNTRVAYVLRDMHKWLDPVVLRGMRTLARRLQAAPRNEARAMIVITPSNEVPPELAGHTTVLEYPLPERREIGDILDNIVKSLPEEIASSAVTNGEREAAIDAAVGLNAEEAANCYAQSLVTTRRIDPKAVASEKRRVISREGLLSWIDPDPRGLDAVGGLDQLKAELSRRRLALSQKARNFGLPAPKGYMFTGISGCGKSLTAKAVAAAWGTVLLRLDIGAMMSKWVGESEANLRRALSLAEAVAPCILWLDEIEKAFAGVGSQESDGGTSARSFGTFLTWMQEKAAPVVVIATANDIAGMPPEFLRKGRFDEIFFVDLPTTVERAAILRATIKQYDRDPDAIDAAAVAVATKDFTGSEIAELVPDALFAAYADGERDITTDDLLEAAGTVVPLSKTAADKINELRKWAKGRARFASKPESAEGLGGRAIDL